MLKNNNAILFLFFFLSPVLLFSQYNTVIKAEILVDDNTEFLTLRGKAFNISEVHQNLRYVFSVIKKDSSGGVLSNTKQEGVFSLDSFQNTKLSQTTINKSETNEIIVLLLIYNDKNKLLGKQRWSQFEKQQETPIIIQKEEFEEIIYDTNFLKGIVTEDTRTKPGRDFYRLFYSKYELNNVNADEIVSVKEFVFGRRNTKIEVRLGNTLVSQFFLQPKEEYLKQMASITLSRVLRAIQNKKNIDNQIERY